MASSFGVRIRVTLFGQSHSPAIGVVIDGLPAGENVDLEAVGAFMARRAPGGALATQRREGDKATVLSGLVEGVTCGAPLCAVIENTDTRPGDYENLRDTPRPAHADYTAYVKHRGYNDVRGGGHFSGRLTAPLCFAGAVCAQCLERRGVTIGSHLWSVGHLVDAPFDAGINSEELNKLKQKPFPARELGAEAAMGQRISQAITQRDSVGGVVECAAVGVPAGLGDPFFDSVESRMAAMLFSLPGVKSVEFGLGLGASLLSGSQNNDDFIVKNGEIRTQTNNHGGILGGITSGMPIVVRAGFKPTPSIGLEQRSVSLSERTEKPLTITGRHDPCIALRAVPCVEAGVALVLADLML